MNFLEEYKKELLELFDNKGYSIYLEEINEVLNEYRNIEQLNYNELLKIFGTPEEFVKEYFSNRSQSVIRTENKRVLFSIKYINLTAFVVMIYFVFLVPFSEVRHGSNVTFSRSTFQLATQDSLDRFIIGPFLFTLLFLVLNKANEDVIFKPISNLVDYFRMYLKHILALLAIVLAINIYIIWEAFDIFKEYYEYEAEDICKNIYETCYDNYAHMLNTMQWLIVWIVSAQAVLLLFTMFYRLNRNGLFLKDFEEMERIEIDATKYSPWIARIYFINISLIMGIYAPLYTLLLYQNDYSMKMILLLILVDFLITILIVIQAILFIGIAISVNNISEQIREKEFSLTKNKKPVLLYLIYFFTTLLPDNYFYNTDGAIIVSSIISISFLVIIWIGEYPEHKRKIVSIVMLSIFSIFIWDNFLYSLLFTE